MGAAQKVVRRKRPPLTQTVGREVNMEEIVMAGVEEYSEGHEVSLEIESGEVVICAINQGGYDSTKVSLRGVLVWLAENAQQSAQPTDGILRDLQASFTPQQLSALRLLFTPPVIG